MRWCVSWGQRAERERSAPSQNPGDFLTRPFARAMMSLVSSALSHGDVRRAVSDMSLTPSGLDAYFEGVLDVMSGHGTRFIGACCHLTDPATGSFTWAGLSGEMPGDFASAIENEFLEDDV